MYIVATQKNIILSVKGIFKENKYEKNLAEENNATEETNIESNLLRTHFNKRRYVSYNLNFVLSNYTFQNWTSGQPL